MKQQLNCRDHDLGGGGKFQNWDLIFDTRNIFPYQLLRKACISYKAYIMVEGLSLLLRRSPLRSGRGEDLWMAQGQKKHGSFSM